MCEHYDNDINELSLDMFNRTLRNLARRKPEKYKFILKGGQSLIDATFKAFSVIWQSEIIPDDWFDSVLIQRFKCKGSVSDLNMYRHLHLKSEFQKFFTHIVISEAQSNISKNMSKFQIATKIGHRLSEHLFFIKSIVSLLQSRKQSAIISMWDISHFFDAE